MFVMTRFQQWSTEHKAYLVGASDASGRIAAQLVPGDEWNAMGEKEQAGTIARAMAHLAHVP